MDWSRRDWIGLKLFGLDWILLCWTGMDWMESDWIGSGLDSARLCWIGMGQVGLVLECVGLYCKWIRQHQAGLVGPDGLDWIGLG